jgi:hypothetical protein
VADGKGRKSRPRTVTPAECPPVSHRSPRPVTKIAAGDCIQFARIIEEVWTIAGRAGVTIAPPPKPGFSPGRSVLEAVQWAFSARMTLVGVSGTQQWRDSFSRLGPPTVGESGLMVSEYQRSELIIPAISPLACFYPWLKQPGLRSVIRYTASGMSAIAGFFLGLAKVARCSGQPIRLLTTPLYWETKALIELDPCHGLFVWECHQTSDGLLSSIEVAEGPCAVFLDSSETLETISLVTDLQHKGTPTGLLAVGWDTTCIPRHTEVRWGEIGAPLILVRSHIKLDQLGLELSSLGSTTAVARGTLLPAAAAFLETFLEWSPRYCQLFGVNASGDALRRLYRLGLPDDVLGRQHNDSLIRANRAGAQRLSQLLEGCERIRLIDYPHGCFCALHLSFPARSSARFPRPGPITRVARELHEQAATHGLPLFNSAGFGFAFTAALGYETTSGAANGGSVIRIAFGGHDPPLVDSVAKLIVDVAREAVDRTLA